MRACRSPNGELPPPTNSWLPCGQRLKPYGYHTGFDILQTKLPALIEKLKPVGVENITSPMFQPSFGGAEGYVEFAHACEDIAKETQGCRNDPELSQPRGGVHPLQRQAGAADPLREQRPSLLNAEIDTYWCSTAARIR